MNRGEHLLIDCEGVAPVRLEDPGLMRDLLLRLANDCALTVCSGPHLVPFTPVGLTGFVVLRESHIAFHTYPEFGAVALDLYSCSPVPRPRVLDTIRDILAPTRLKSRLVRRMQSSTNDKTTPRRVS